MIGFAMCGSFCTHRASLEVLDKLVKKGNSVLPILSFAAGETDTRFGKASELIQTLEKMTGSKPVMTVKDAEPLGPKIALDALLICPCTGNTVAKLANGITDTPVTMAAKAHLRCSRPLLIALASNDAMSANLKNIAALLEKKNVWFVPMKQDDVEKKPHSLVADFSLVEESLESALKGIQKRPLFL